MLNISTVNVISKKKIQEEKIYNINKNTKISLILILYKFVESFLWCRSVHWWLKNSKLQGCKWNMLIIQELIQNYRLRDLFCTVRGGFVLTHSCLGNFLQRVVWTFVNFENNFHINHNFTKYLKESCRSDFVQHFSFKYFLKITFGWEMSPK